MIESSATIYLSALQAHIVNRGLLFVSNEKHSFYFCVFHLPKKGATFAVRRRGVIYHVPPVALDILRELPSDYLFLGDCGT